jgi:hypothetical protein
VLKDSIFRCRNWCDLYGNVQGVCTQFLRAYSKRELFCSKIRKKLYHSKLFLSASESFRNKGAKYSVLMNVEGRWTMTVSGGGAPFRRCGPGVSNWRPGR